MNRYELLNILYAERSRVEKQFSQPGWTLWAIVAALAPISWKAWKMAEQCEQWQYVIIVFNLLYFLSLIYELCVFSYNNAPQTPIWKKGDANDIIQSVIGIIMCVWIASTQLWIIPFSFHPMLYWTSFAIVVLFLIAIVLVLKQAIAGYLPNNLGWWNLVFVLPIIPPIILIILYLCELGYEPSLLRLGVLLFAIFFLLTLLPIGQKKRFARIDRLITQVLYDFEKVDEIAVLRLLELQVIGFRYGRYLSEQKLEGYYVAINELITCANKLSECIKQGDSEQIDDIIKEGGTSLSKVSNTMFSVAYEINQVYDRNNVDSSLLPLVSAIKVGDEAINFWQKMKSIQGDSPDNVEERISQAYAETIGREDIQQKINDTGLRNINRYRLFNEDGN